MKFNFQQSFPFSKNRITYFLKRPADEGSRGCGFWERPERLFLKARERVTAGSATRRLSSLTSLSSALTPPLPVPRVGLHTGLPHSQQSTPHSICRDTIVTLCFSPTHNSIHSTNRFLAHDLFKFLFLISKLLKYIKCIIEYLFFICLKENCSSVGK